MDEAGRVVIPKVLRDHLGLRAGELDVHVEGAGLHLEPLAGDGLAEREGRLVVAASGSTMTDENVRALRDAAAEPCLVDTSAAMALLVTDHEHLEPTFAALSGRDLGLCGHAAFESCSVLTRLPGHQRLSPPASSSRRISPTPDS